MTFRKIIITAMATIIFILACFLYASTVLAGEISEQIEAKRLQISPDDYIRVVVFPVSTVDRINFKASLNAFAGTMADRQRDGLARLKEVAQQSQQPLMPFLTRLHADGKIRNLRPYWVDNVIEMEVKPAAMAELASQATVERIELYPDIVSLPIEKSTVASPQTTAVAVNLRAVRADSAWALGYDGRGRIVCIFDTGVDGLHPALSGNYHGNKGYPAEACWYSSIDTTTFPHDYPQAGAAYSHGTHVAGIIVGHDDLTGDTIGVAPGADWIAAATIDIPGVSVFAAFQWAVDPDGDPNTVSDIPDVINHSWGVRDIGCADVFDGVIDHAEALGIVNLFSCGNEGAVTDAIRYPANRADDSLTNFAVGAINPVDSAIYSASSRGPSSCDHLSIKPNVVAPGVLIRSSVPGGSYSSRSGTSMAAPHVSGAVAILRQKNPEATVDQIKTALLNATADLGTAGPDNTFGWGLIDIVRALDLLDSLTTPALQVHRLPTPPIDPGDELDLSLVLKNAGADAANVVASFSNPQSGLTLLTDQISFGSIAASDTAGGESTLDLSFDPGLETGRSYAVDMTLTADGGYVKNQTLSFFVGDRGRRSFYNHATASITFTISNFGAYGFHDDTYFPLGYEGFQFGGSENDLYEAAFLIGTDSTHISDCIRNIVQEVDNDFAVVPGGNLTASSPGTYADQETEAAFDDSYAEHPLGIEITQRSYAWVSSPNDQFIILEYVLTNSSLSTYTNLRAGLYLDWDLYSWAANHGAVVAGENLGYMCYATAGGTDSSYFRGVAVLNDEGLINHRLYACPDETYGTLFRESRKSQGLFDNSRPSLDLLTDVSHITATGPFTLAPGESDTAALAILGGNSWATFLANAERARQAYQSIITDVTDAIPILPNAFTLRQNYPNPFNPGTSISFSLPRAGRITVDVFDILGRRVASPADGHFPAGDHTVSWNGTDRRGCPVASGIYFYRLTFDGASLTRKMMLLK